MLHHHLKKSAGRVWCHGDKYSDVFFSTRCVRDFIGDKGDGPESLAWEFHEHHALKPGSPAALTKHADDLLGGTINTFQQRQIFNKAIHHIENLPADDKRAQCANEVDKSRSEHHSQYGSQIPRGFGGINRRNATEDIGLEHPLRDGI